VFELGEYEEEQNNTCSVETRNAWEPNDYAAEHQVDDW